MSDYSRHNFIFIRYKYKKTQIFNIPILSKLITGKVNEAGLFFYENLIDALIAANITPYVTLFHWDYPEALQQKGGWLYPDSSDWFAEYTKVVVERLSDRVKHWLTLNEPQMFVNLGHNFGTHAPGLNLSAFLF